MDSTMVHARRMARREALVLAQYPALEAWVTDPPVRVSIRTVPCLWCPVVAAAHLDPEGLRAMPGVRVLAAGEPALAGSALLTALPCEWLTARSLLPLVLGVDESRPRRPMSVMTRAAAAAPLARDSRVTFGALLAALDARESWIDAWLGLAQTAVPSEDAADVAPVLASSARLTPYTSFAGAQIGSDTEPRCLPLVPHIITPHLLSSGTAAVNDEYFACRRSVLAAELGLGDKLRS